MSTIFVYVSLFTICFLSATLLPMQSELVLAGLLAGSGVSWVGLLVVATLGNTLGAVVNWGLGIGIERFRHSRWFPVNAAQLERAEFHYRRWGRVCLFFAWLPVLGDAFTVVAGLLRERLWIFLLIVGAGKLARYLVVAAGVAGVWGGT